MLRKPLWVWMPGQAEPTMAGTLTHSPSGYSLAYERDFIDSGIIFRLRFVFSRIR